MCTKVHLRSPSVNSAARERRSILKTSRGALKTVRSLLQKPADGPRCVVAVSQVVVQRGEAALLALHLHLSELLFLEARIAGRSPAVRSAVHGETGRQCSVRANDQRILPRTAVPVLQL